MIDPELLEEVRTHPLSRLARAKPGEWVLDPYCGRGTTNYAARLLGLPSVGLDSNPVAAAIAAAKVISTTPEAVTKVARGILAGDPARHVPEGEFWTQGFHRGTLGALCQIREALIEDCRSPARVGLRALMLASLHGPLNRGEASYLSNQMPRTYASKPAYYMPLDFGASTRSFAKSPGERCESWPETAYDTSGGPPRNQ